MNGAHISLVSLGVADIERSVRFYEALGWVRSGTGDESVAFLQGGNIALGLIGRAALAEDANVDDSAAGFSAVTLAVNLPSEADVDEHFQKALAAGAAGRKPPQKVFWGGYSGYFADPDGHLWEVAHNPFFPLDDTGAIRLPGETE